MKESDVKMMMVQEVWCVEAAIGQGDDCSHDDSNDGEAGMDT